MDLLIGNFKVQGKSKAVFQKNPVKHWNAVVGFLLYVKLSALEYYMNTAKIILLVSTFLSCAGASQAHIQEQDNSRLDTEIKADTLKTVIASDEHDGIRAVLYDDHSFDVIFPDLPTDKKFSADDVLPFSGFTIGRTMAGAHSKWFYSQRQALSEAGKKYRAASLPQAVNVSGSGRHATQNHAWEAFQAYVIYTMKNNILSERGSEHNEFTAEETYPDITICGVSPDGDFVLTASYNLKNGRKMDLCCVFSINEEGITYRLYEKITRANGSVYEPLQEQITLGLSSVEELSMKEQVEINPLKP